MKNLILLLVVFSQFIFSQELKLSKNSLHFTCEYRTDSLLLYNTGTLPLLIKSINSTYINGYGLSIKLKDTTINNSVITLPNNKLSFLLDVGDSAKLLFNGLGCTTGKLVEIYYDSIVIHSNSISDTNTYIIVVGDRGNSVEDYAIRLNGYILYQNYPNPFNPSTSISFYLPSEENITLIVYDELGRQISTVYSGKLRAGNYSKTWDASKLTSGIYFYKLETKRFSAIKKMILLK